MTDKQFEKTGQALAVLAEASRQIVRLGGVLGVFQVPPADYLEGVKRKKLAQLAVSVEEIEQLIAERNQARSSKNWARADEIRAGLQQKGIVLEDRKDGTTWSVV